MRKSFFLSILALAAVASCTKSEVVDTKFDEAIGFETYLGRDAQTKASETTTANVEKVYVYGYYTGASEWRGTSTANLWNPLTLEVADDGKATIPPGQEKYWANDNDLYTFLAYAPIAETPAEGSKPTNPLTITVTNSGPTLTYKIPGEIPSQIDLLYATPQKDRTKDTWGENKSMNGVVPLTMNHALSRITVKAKDAETDDLFKFDVKEITLSGKFYTSGNIVLADGKWSSLSANPEQTTYVFHRNATETNTDGNISYSYNAYNKEKETELPSNNYKNYAERTVNGENKVDNYLMMIPTTESATLTVKYTTIYEGSESNLITKEFSITSGFAEGKAYAFQLDFTNNATPITFTVNVTNWTEQTVETGNPENSSDWTTPTPTTQN